jgi:hypothetical protein
MRDPVPHLPFESTLGDEFRHVPQEVWETSNSPLQFQQCSATNGEDPTCSDSIRVFNILNHAEYMGHNALDGVIHGCLYTDN